MQHNTNLKPNTTHEEGFHTLDIQYDKSRNLAWYYTRPYPRPCCTPELIQDIQSWYSELIDSQMHHGDVKYIAIACNTPGIFNLGGDLNLFTKMIRNQDREGLLRYAIACIDTLYANHTGLGNNVTTISLVQGDALGGGLEFAMSSHVLVAERSAKMGMPEILFNLFPGMGAYSLLSRKVGSALAEKMILSGKIYSAEEMYDLGVVDILAEDGEGEQAVYAYIKKESHASNGYRAFRKSQQCCNPVPYDELKETKAIWVDAALKLEDNNLRMMERLIARQSSKIDNR
ncbi:MAG: crotonase/enoyl-CoA hydratase family protein [Mariprofundus sp.]